MANGRTYSFVRWLNSLVINRSCTRACTVAQGKTTGGANTREATVDCTKAVYNRPDYKGRSRVVLIAANFDVASLNNNSSKPLNELERIFFSKESDRIRG